MKSIKLILAVAAMTLTAVLAGCGGDDPATSPEDPTNNSTNDQTDDSTPDDPSSKTGVLINGVVWAECNVDAFGTFAASAESPGMFYQWNRPKAWPATGDVTGWNNSAIAGDVWDAVNDPCPSGWCVPTKDEQATLLEKGKVTYVWTTLNGVHGGRFTDKVSGASIFLPVPGHRFDDGAQLGGDDGYYWSSSPNSMTYAWYLGVGSINAQNNVSLNRTYGYSIRCVHPSNLSFTVTFVSNGGSAIEAQTVVHGGRVIDPTAPTREGYAFAGWFTDDGNFTDSWNFAIRTVGADMTLYAKWTVFDVTPDPGARVSIDGATINGVVWAGRNVDAFGTFAAAPESPGMFYQWNRPKAWPATGDVTGWDDTEQSGDVWDAANDPCPSGWRVPTKDEHMTLVDAHQVTYVWTILNGVYGSMFTDKVSGASIFLPAAGCRVGLNGGLVLVGTNSIYWSGSYCGSTASPWCLYASRDTTLPSEGSISDTCSYGYSVRCVRQ